MNNAIITNIVSKEILRQRQLATLEVMKDALANSFGPYGSNTISYNNEGYPRYTKDGHTILKSIMFGGEIEQSVLADVEEETRAQAKRVGDSTTSVTILSYYIYDAITKIADEFQIPPADLVKRVKGVIECICKEIEREKRVARLEDIYNIALISSNGDEKLASMIAEVYKTYGLNVYIDVLAGSEETTYVKELDGMILDCGFGDISLVNIPGKNVCQVRNPKIYFFKDPVDTVEMGAFFDKIIYDNILKPAYEDKKPENMVPTIILCPHLSRDYTAMLNSVTEACAKAAAQGVPNGLPLNIITNITDADGEMYDDIRKLCGGRFINKYIDPKVQEEDIKKGLAPTPDNIHEFAGSAEMVESDVSKTKFVNPKLMRDKDGKFTDTFNSLLKYLDANIEDLEKQKSETVTLYRLKKRKNSLLGNMVEIYVGGLTLADRDQLRDLMEDAVLNCRSAVLNGVGYGANYEGLRASKKVMDVFEDADSKIDCAIAKAIYEAYRKISILLYQYYPRGEREKMVDESILQGCPFDIRNDTQGDNVLSSIDTDICVLNSIAKIVTLMATSNQFLLKTLNTNKY